MRRCRRCRISSQHAVSDARETAIASAVLLDASFLDAVPEFSPDDIRDEFAGLIVATAIRMHRDGHKVDLYTVADALDRGGALQEKLGPDAMQRMLALVQSPMTADPAGLARAIHAEAQRRRLVSQLELLRTAAADPTYSTEALQRQLTAAADGLQVATDDTDILDCVDLIEQFPNLRDPVVEGFLRRGETCNVIAKSKVGKSWFGYGLGFSVALGRDWLGRFPTRRGRVLLLDNELHPETLSSRIKTVMCAMGLRPADCRGWFDIKALRGHTRDIHSVAPILRRIPQDKYSLIIVDAFYRLLPSGESENDNSAMTQVYNAVDRYGEQTGAAFALIHHATKGGQSDKDVTDVGSGAGSISRAADTHLILRPHEENDAVVLAAKTRSWAEPSPVGLRWFYPAWQIDDNLDPESLKGRRVLANSDEAKSKRLDEKSEKVLQYLTTLKDTGATKSKIKDHTGINAGLGQIIDALVKAGRIAPCEIVVKSNGKPFEGWKAIESCTTSNV